MIVIDLRKQQAFDVDPKAIQQTIFNRNLDLAATTLTFFIFEEAKETILDFFTRNCASIENSFCLKIMSI